MALSRDQIAQRIAREIKDGDYVNLGIGIPTLVANYVPAGMASSPPRRPSTPTSSTPENKQ